MKKKILVLKSTIALAFLLTIANSNPALSELIEESDEASEATSKPVNPSHTPADDSKPVNTQSGGTSKPTPNANKAPSKQKSGNVKQGDVKFKGETLSGFRNQGWLTLEENVVVTQDDIRLEADKATIYFEPGAGKNEVKEVHAMGSVKFQRIDPETGQPIKANGKEAVFNNAKRQIVMKGDPVLYRGDDVVKGKVIYYNLTNGWVKADRVEGVVQPAQKKVGTK